MLAKLRTCIRQEEGQGLAEYSLILVLMALACIAALTTLGGSISTFMNNLAGSL